VLERIPVFCISLIGKNSLLNAIVVAKVFSESVNSAAVLWISLPGSRYNLDTTLIQPLTYSECPYFNTASVYSDQILDKVAI